MLLILILLLVVPSLVISLTTYNRTVNVITDVGFATLKSDATAAEQKLATAVGAVENELDLYTDFRVHSFLFACQNSDALSALSIVFGLFQRYDEMTASNPYGAYIEDIGVLSQDGTICGQNVGYKKIAEDERLAAFFSKAGSSVTAVPAAELFDDRDASKSFLFTRAVVSGTGWKGIVYVRIGRLFFDSLFTSLPSESTTLYGILTLDGQNIASSKTTLFSDLLKNTDPADAAGKVTDVGVNAQKYYLYIGSADLFGWHVAVADAKANLLLPLTRISSIAILSIVVSIIAALLVSILFNRAIFVPIVSLQEHMQLVRSNHLNVKPVYHGSYEIEQLYESFNAMIERIRYLLDSLVEEQKNLRTAELKALQAQINPHFLYNSLNSIIHVAEQGKMDTVIDIVMSLAHYYQSVLSNGMDHVPLETEIASTRAYLEIMQIHCYDILRYSFEIDDSVKKCTLFPKLSLQPIVENAIFHGLKGIDNGGWIYIRAHADENDQLTISVRDTGIGMSEQTLANLTRTISAGLPTSSDGSSTYGLANVHQRLKLFFGSSFKMEICSKLNEGTTVTITASLKSVRSGEETN